MVAKPPPRFAGGDRTRDGRELGFLLGSVLFVNSAINSSMSLYFVPSALDRRPLEMLRALPERSIPSSPFTNGVFSFISELGFPDEEERELCMSSWRFFESPFRAIAELDLNSWYERDATEGDFDVDLRNLLAVCAGGALGPAPRARWLLGDSDTGASDAGTSIARFFEERTSVLPSVCPRDDEIEDERARDC